MMQKYASALNGYAPFAQTVKTLLPQAASVHERVTVQVTAPVLLAYVLHVLRTAKEKGIQRLYFLSRDGYIMLEMAKELAKHMPDLPELRYLYCSRASLRLPSYHRIPEPERLDLLLHRGTNLTINHILDRASLSPEQYHAVLAELGEQNPRAPLSENDYVGVCEKLRNSVIFRDAVLQNSRESYDAILAYLQQEGLLDGTAFAVVDTGWTGSMQRSLRQLSDTLPPLTGFYFGMFSRPKSVEDGVYDTFYFSPDSSIGLRTKFNNNLFECLCAAPHGMTIGYTRDQSQRMIPVCKPELSDAAMDAAVNAQISLCREFARNCAPLLAQHPVTDSTLHHICRQLLQGLMYRPTAEEARAFAVFRFCDDVTESYHAALVQTNCRRVLWEHLLPVRILRRLSGKKPSAELFWSYGTLAVSGLPLHALLRPALRHWDVLRYLLEHGKAALHKSSV
ncbi:MAG: hypothetical protein E7502_08065 [Ruminococcus sp.]|nr:hypothetical protein [Ruminococcus sp.]